MENCFVVMRVERRRPLKVEERTMRVGDAPPPPCPGKLCATTKMKMGEGGLQVLAEVRSQVTIMTRETVTGEDRRVHGTVLHWRHDGTNP